MKRNSLILIITYFFILTHISHAMQTQNNKSIICKKITAVQKPNAVKYLTNDHVVIGGQGCSIINLVTNEEKKISNFDCSYVALDPNKKKIAFSYDKTIELYNAETNKQEWFSKEKYPIHSFDFSHCGNTIFLCLAEDPRGNHIISKRNSLDTKDDDINNSNSAVIALHPKKPTVCVAEMWGDLLIYQSYDLTLEPRLVFLTHHNSHCQVSSDGLIAVGDPDGRVISIVDSNIKSHIYQSIRSRKHEMFIRMLFYPRGSVLAVSSMLLRGNLPRHLIRYWDVKTSALKLIYTTIQLNFSWDHDFSFSPDGKEVTIAFENECVSCFVPWQIRYECGTKEKFPLMLFLLKNYVDKHQEILDQDIPNDIKLLLANTFFKTFER